MSPYQVIFPGIGFFVGFSLISFCIALFFVYSKTKNKSYLYTALFCGLTAPYAIEQFIVQLKLATPITAFYFMCLTRFFYLLSLYFYGEAMNDYISLPKKIMTPYRAMVATLTVLTVLPPVSFFLWGDALVVDMIPSTMPQNYFVNSYMVLFGTPKPFMSILQVLSTITISSFAFAILLRTHKQSIDPFLSLGLAFTLFTVVFEAMGLAINIAYFVPVIFLSNYIEAARLTFVYIKKYLIDHEHFILSE